MAALSNILPITFLSSFSFLILAFLTYYCWRAFPRRVGPNLGNPDYEVEEIPGTTDFVMVGRKGHGKKKVKKPKLWEIWVSSFSGRHTHERKLSSGSSFSDLSADSGAGRWAELKVGTSSSILTCGALIFASLARNCHLCQKFKQVQYITHYCTPCPSPDGPSFGTNRDHN